MSCALSRGRRRWRWIPTPVCLSVKLLPVSSHVSSSWSYRSEKELLTQKTPLLFRTRDFEHLRCTTLYFFILHFCPDLFVFLSWIFILVKILIGAFSDLFICCSNAVPPHSGSFKVYLSHFTKTCFYTSTVHFTLILEKMLQLKHKMND